MATATQASETYKAEFSLSYAGESEYLIRQNYKPIGKVRVRTFGNKRMEPEYNGDYFQTGILPTVGTVMWKDCDKFHEFPPREIVALFPGYVGCRLILHPTTPGFTIRDEGFQWPTSEYQYDGPKPELIQDPIVPDYITFKGRRG